MTLDELRLLEEQIAALDRDMAGLPNVCPACGGRALEVGSRDTWTLGTAKSGATSIGESLSAVSRPHAGRLFSGASSHPVA